MKGQAFIVEAHDQLTSPALPRVSTKKVHAWQKRVLSTQHRNRAGFVGQLGPLRNTGTPTPFPLCSHTEVQANEQAQALQIFIHLSRDGDLRDSHTVVHLLLDRCPVAAGFCNSPPPADAAFQRTWWWFRSCGLVQHMDKLFIAVTQPPQ